MSQRQVVDTVGNHISDNPSTDIPDNISEAKEIIVQVDGGHVKSGYSSKAERLCIYYPEIIFKTCYSFAPL